MHVNFFDNKKTEKYFLSQCAGWVKELYNFDNEIKTNRFLSSKSNKGLVIRLIREDSYYTTYKFELNLGFASDYSWRENKEDHQVNVIDKVITDFESIIKKLPSTCTICGCHKDEGNHILNIIQGNSKDIFFHEVTVDYRPTERCHTCNDLVNRDEHNIHLFNLSRIKNNEFILPQNRFVNQFNEHKELQRFKSPLKVRIINSESKSFEYLSEKCFMFNRENLFYKSDFSEFTGMNINDLSDIKDFKKGIYAGYNTGCIDVFGKEIFSGDIILFKCVNFTGTSVVANSSVFRNSWSSFLSELSEMEIIGNIFFDLDKKSNINILVLAQKISKEGFDDYEDLNDLQKVKQFLSSKVTPSFKKRKWFS